MADPRTFVLIGEFKDGITPELQKINNQLAALKNSFSNVGGKGARTASRDMGRFSAAVSSLTDNLKANNQELRASIAPLKEYRKEIGKTVSAYKQLNQAGGNVKGLEATNKALREQMRLLEQVRAKSNALSASQGVANRRMSQMRRAQPSMATGGGYTPPPTPRGGRGGGAGGGMGAHMAEFGFAFTLGNAISQPIQNAIVAGFQIGVGLMTKPFEYFANQLKERIQDEQSDIKAAGGIFSIARRQQNPFVKTMDEAMEFTQENNKRMAELAAALPGNTQQYIEVSKRISDSISRIVTSDKDRAIQYANQMRAERGAAQLEGTGGKAVKGAITELLGEMTKKTVLAGLGTGGGPGGVAGAYGLPQLTERMLTQEQVSMGQFQRYAAIFKDPLIMEALNRFIPKINAAAAGTLERYEVMRKFYDEVLPPEMIRKFERSTAGVIELFNTTIFGPETGLFGLGRKMVGLGKVMDDYGNYVKVFEDGTRKAGVSFAEATDANLSLFDMLRDSFANLGMIFDPINKVAKLLVDFRHATGRFLNAFESYKKGFEDMLKDMGDLEKSEFLKIGIDLRASLAAVNNFFANAGIISESEFQKNAKQLMSASFDYKAMMGGMLDTLLNSKAAEGLGELAGEIVGTVLSEVAKATGFISGRVAGTNKLFDGIKAGFEKAGGVEALKNIFSDVFKTLFKILLEVMKMIPFEAYMLIGAMVVLPAAVQGLGMKIAEGVLAFITRLGKDIPEMLNEAPKGFKGLFTRKGKTAYTSPIGPLPEVKPTPSQRLAGRTRGTGPTYMASGVKPSLTPKGFLKSAVGGDQSLLGKRLISAGKSPLKTAKGIPVSITNVAKNAFATAKGGGLGGMLSGAKGFLGKGMAGLGKVGGIATIGVGIVEALMALFKGESLGMALGKGAGPVLGTIIGTALLGPLGGIIGGMIGSMESITEPLGAAFESVIGTLGTTFEFLGQIGGDLLGLINGFVRMLPGVSQDFDVLRFAITALTAPFRLLELMIMGLYEGYLRLKEMIPGLGLSAEEKKKKDELFLARMEKTAALELDFKQAYNKKAREEYQKELDNLRAKGQGEQERARIVENALKIIDEKLKKKDPKYVPPATRGATPTPSGSKPTSGKPKVGYLTKNGVKGWMGTDGTWTPLATAKVPTRSKPIGDGSGGLSKPVGGKPSVAKEVTQTAQNTNNLNKKATDQIKETTSVKAGVDKTTQAVKELATKITPQTNLQTTTAAIYNLLASGQLRVQGSVAPGSFSGPYNPYTNPLGNLPFDPNQKNPNKPSNIFTWAKGGLGDAVASEMKNKPSGSDLVIANSSETVIPAAGGYGMVEFVDTLKWGFATMIGAFKQAQQKQDSLLNGINQTLKANQQQTNARLMAMEKKFSAPSMPGGLGGAAAGGVDAFTPIAQRYGLQMTSGYRPGDPGWHGANRARDFSNGTGPTPQMMQFAQYMASTYGSNLKELIYTPLGFSIKNGQQVPPYAQGSHYNHVHVAYAAGLGNPAFFGEQKDAQRWEKKHLGAGVKSITTNTAEIAQAGDGMIGPSWLPWNWGKLVDQERKTSPLNRTNRMLEQMQREGYISPNSLYKERTSSAGGAPINITSPITINQQPGQDADELASIVALKIGEAVADARSASLFV